MMPIELDVAGRRVVVVGDRASSRRAVARYLHAGADVRVISAAAVERLFTRIDGALPAEPLPDIVVWMADGEQAKARIVGACRRERVWLVEDRPVGPTPRGQVTLVGGGPGEPGLMTVDARRSLADADVVLFDRLGPVDDLEAWAPGAELIDVGKTPGHHAVPQAEIEGILIERALRGLRVVRLKGGDSFVFGRGGEEIIACRARGIPVTVVPGVTSAIAVPSAVGIPVTHREVSRAFTVVSGHVPFSEAELSHLVGLGGTLVVLMGISTLPHLAAGLLRHGMRPDMPLAIVERGYRVDQRSTTTTIDGVLGVLAIVAPRSPAVIVIGEVVMVPEWADRAARASDASWDDEALSPVPIVSE